MIDSNQKRRPKTAGASPHPSPKSPSQYDNSLYASMGLHSPLTNISSQSEMLDIKLNRKKAESDLQLLANRISLLKLEEQKALSKIKETTIRAKEINE